MWKFNAKTHYIAELRGLEEGENVRLAGWVQRKSELGGIVFIRMRDATGSVQVVLREGNLSEQELTAARGAGIEASIIVEGSLRRDPRAPGGLEVIASKFILVGDSKDFPIKPGVGEEFLLDNRHLHIRTTRMRNALMIRMEVMRATEEWFVNNGFVRVEAPTFVGAAVEGGATLFEVPYFGKKAYLTQSSQFYLEAAIFSFENVYTIQPSFRAEKSRTRRHLTEFWHAEAEMAWADLNGMMDVVESLVKYIVEKVVERASDKLEALGRRMEAIEGRFPRITYDEALELAKRKGAEIEWGEDFGTEVERLISLEFDLPVFVTHYPKKAKAFYHKQDPKRPEVVLCADLLAPEGIGEIVGGGQRIESENELISRIVEEGLNPEDYKWYLDLRRYGSVPHSGFGLGIERTIRWIAGLPHIRDAIPFPRTPVRLYP
ncbi:asparagine--tRNA ligase [Candidatus Korarchaeum cryptofilum]|jgi:asparaginyl-tRNA synthetase|uniref:Asparagine--tRNA ligase n=2 Tax=Candidatus Korarchaeum cryptofilum TaxID=498846 RepID=B1L6F2_KORCO|nr:asparagine--tRNA ligase [Candidatus Korarchaeum cryptofilum]ACB08031.1 asparaginyl-tRNA synthetase [Candidatus Korarchaeum cryptofilum OPF8]RSN69674.1 asparagine--tRNA ligase [Candidatus Korarchaeum cryptofilum]